MNRHFFLRIFDGLCSLKLAVLVIASLASALAVATVIESKADTQTAQYWVYRAPWFAGILVLLAVNIFCVALSRYPWTKKHIPFLLAHLGILTLLAGSWITDRAGIDGSLRVSEGETQSVLELDTALLILNEKERVDTLTIPWLPVGVSFRPLDLKTLFHSDQTSYPLVVDRYLTHAESELSFIPRKAKIIEEQVKTEQNNPSQNSKSIHSQFAQKKESALPAIRIRLAGGPMQVSEEIWLWEGAPQWQTVQAGPAQLSIGQKLPDFPKGKPSLAIQPISSGVISYVAQSSQGKITRGKLIKNPETNSFSGSLIQSGWKGGVTLTVLDWIPDAIPYSVYRPSRVQSGPQAPASAIHLSIVRPSESRPSVLSPSSTVQKSESSESDSDESQEMWLGLGDRATLAFQGREVLIAYLPRRLVLPFSVELKHFQVEYDPGSTQPAAYSSEVNVHISSSDSADSNNPNGSGKSAPIHSVISMNEPLSVMGYTLYQTSYEDSSPRPVTSILSVNRDPGRIWKYLGSLLIVLGSVLLFAVKAIQQKKRTNISTLNA